VPISGSIPTLCAVSFWGRLCPLLLRLSSSSAGLRLSLRPRTCSVLFCSVPLCSVLLCSVTTTVHVYVYEKRTWDNSRCDSWQGHETNSEGKTEKMFTREERYYTRKRDYTFLCSEEHLFVPTIVSREPRHSDQLKNSDWFIERRMDSSDSPPPFQAEWIWLYD
jgi:hypothetical protein